MIELLPGLPMQAPVVLAPMEGVVDWALRDLLTSLGGTDLCVTEFIRVTDRLLPAADFFKYAPELKEAQSTAKAQTRSGIPVLIQLLGGKPGPMAENAARAAELGAPGIDLNFGCPAKTVNRHDGGAALLKNPERVFAVVSAVRSAVPSEIPVSAKIRLGFADKSLFLDIARAAEAGGARWLAVHARTRDEGYRPPAHWEYVAQIREEIKIPTIANGEVWTADDYRRCRNVSGCEAVMIGRGLVAAPDLALRLKHIGLRREGFLGDATPACELLPFTKLLGLLIEFTKLCEHARALLQSKPSARSNYAICRCKQWLKALSRTYPEAALLFEEIKRIEDLSSLVATLKASNSAVQAKGRSVSSLLSAEASSASLGLAQIL